MIHPTPSPTPKRNLKRKALLGAGLIAGITAGTLGLTTGTSGAIVGGEAAAPNANPWQVSLQVGGGHSCGGSIVSPTVIVTAAHCTEGISANELSIRAGVTDINSTDGQDREVSKIINHPSYQGGAADIAMLVLSEPLDLSGNVSAVPLATKADVDQATTATTSGWGDLSETDATPVSELREAEVPLVDDASCSAQLGIDPGQETCAGGTGTDSCYGDSGGPLVITTADGSTKLAGVVSWGEECGGNTPGVYAEVPAFSDWIADQVTGDGAAGADSDDGGSNDDESDTEDDGFEIDFDDDLTDDLADDEDTTSEDNPGLGDIDMDALWDELDQMTNAEFDAFINSLSEADFEALFGQYDDVEDAEVDADVDVDVDDDTSDLTDIDAMTDAEFNDYINGLTDEEFDTLLAEWAAEVAVHDDEGERDDLEEFEGGFEGEFDPSTDDEFDGEFDAEFDCPELVG